MERDIIDNIKYIKNISKKKVTSEKIFTKIKKKYPNINQEDIKKILDDMVKDNYYVKTEEEKILHTSYQKKQTFLFPRRKMLMTTQTKVKTKE